MGKSVYSLVLMDEIVQAVDRRANELGTSRSNLINQILAQALEFVTPERRRQDVYSQIERACQGELFQIRFSPTDAVLSARSALSYKYRPTVKYALQLYHKAGETLGELKVWMRTQNERLDAQLVRFFKLWMQLEQGYLSSYLPGGQIPAMIQDSKYIRSFFPPNPVHGVRQELGEAIADYLSRFDGAMQVYFSALAEGNELYKTEEKFLRDLKNIKAVI